MNNTDIEMLKKIRDQRLMTEPVEVKTEMEPDFGSVDHPSHYLGSHGLEVFDILFEFAPSPEYLEGFYWSNVVKYVLRFSQKNGIEDLKKAQVYLEKLVDALDSH